ncbi:Nitroreductase [Tenacibaculum sp. MAR_2009_124]|uniref:nitroreductase family protein n=1 Tax=Tenacibaculum sp. MAR_2009_124 TaxID=1250059 RepID=UPI0008989E68|nr:nitroreductase [Tenacibaculum sp. MAR_2009_124]SEB44390.1 Nitroreductase [Tenacibaculum sp. MAR_2009_124]
MEIESLSEIIKKRRSYYASDFSERHLSKETVEIIIENGLWAPTHKLTQPWRFSVLEGIHRQEMGVFMANYYREIFSVEEFSNERFEETKSYAKNATMIAIFCKPSSRLPEWEEVAAVSCAIQNIWLSCTAMNIGGYWDTGTATMKYVENHAEVKEGEKCLGVFFMGHLKEELTEVNRKRKPLSKKLSWVE